MTRANRIALFLLSSLLLHGCSQWNLKGSVATAKQYPWQSCAASATVAGTVTGLATGNPVLTSVIISSVNSGFGCHLAFNKPEKLDEEIELAQQ